MRENIIKEGCLFKNANTIDGASLIGLHNESGQFYLYMEGYKLAADNLVLYCLETDSNEGKLIFPIIFCYRQYVELMIKDLFKRFSSSSDEEKIRLLKRNSHNLINNWNSLYDEIKEYIKDYEKDDLMKLQNLIIEFNEFDVKSDSFRFPTDKNFNLYHQDWWFIDLKNLYTKMNEISEMFNHIKLEVLKR